MKKIRVYIKIVTCLAIIILITGCGSKDVTPVKMYQYLNCLENGLVQSRDLGNILYTVKYIPPEVLAYREIKNSEFIRDYDSVYQTYSNSITLHLKISMRSPVGDIVDPAIGKASNYSEYSNIIHNMSFNMQENIWISHENEFIYPDLVHFESTIEVQNEKTFYIVFCIPDDFQNLFNKNGNIDLVFNDIFFGTGINHFPFSSKSINNIPNLKL